MATRTINNILAETDRVAALEEATMPMSEAC